MAIELKSGAQAPQIVLFHSVLGVRPAVRQLGDRLCEDGYTVHVPDLYDGATFDDYETAMRFVEEHGGFAMLMERTMTVATDIPTDAVYAGFSNGGGSAMLLALARPGARGAIMYHAGMPVKYLGFERWPSTVPVQVHYTVGDPFREAEAVDGFEADVLASGAPYEFFEYEGSGHLFTDSELPAEYDAAATELLVERTRAFLRALRD